METEQGHREYLFAKGVFPVMVGYRQGKGSPSTTPEYHSELEFMFISQGHGQFFIHDTNYPLYKNTVFVIHNNEVHNFVADPQSSVKRVFLVFPPRIISGSITSSIIKHLQGIHQITLDERQAALTEFLLNEIAAEYKHEDRYWQDVVLNHIESFLVILDRASRGTIAVAPKTNPFTQEVIGYLDQCFTEVSLLAEVADHFYMSRYSFCKAFKQHVGMGFKEYLIHRRIVEAKRLLEETNMKVASIAAEVGFEDLSTFNRNFRLLVGISPSDYRKISS